MTDGNGRHGLVRIGGHTLLAMERWAEAAAAYVSKRSEVWRPLAHPNCFEAKAGLAVARQRLGQSSEAIALVHEVLALVNEVGLARLVEPVLLL